MFYTHTIDEEGNVYGDASHITFQRHPISDAVRVLLYCIRYTRLVPKAKLLLRVLRMTIRVSVVRRVPATRYCNALDLNASSTALYVTL